MENWVSRDILILSDRIYCLTKLTYPMEDIGGLWLIFLGNSNNWEKLIFLCIIKLTLNMLHNCSFGMRTVSAIGQWYSLSGPLATCGTQRHLLWLLNKYYHYYSFSENYFLISVIMCNWRKLWLPWIITTSEDVQLQHIFVFFKRVVSCLMYLSCLHIIVSHKRFYLARLYSSINSDFDNEYPNKTFSMKDRKTENVKNGHNIWTEKNVFYSTVYKNGLTQTYYAMQQKLSHLQVRRSLRSVF